MYSGFIWLSVRAYFQQLCEYIFLNFLQTRSTSVPVIAWCDPGNMRYLVKRWSRHLIMSFDFYRKLFVPHCYRMMTSWSGNGFRITDPWQRPTAGDYHFVRGIHRLLVDDLHKWLIIRGFGDCLVFSLNNLFRNQPGCRSMPWRSCHGNTANLKAPARCACWTNGSNVCPLRSQLLKWNMIYRIALHPERIKE